MHKMLNDIKYSCDVTLNIASGENVTFFLILMIEINENSSLILARVVVTTNKLIKKTLNRKKEFFLKC